MAALGVTLRVLCSCEYMWPVGPQLYLYHLLTFTHQELAPLCSFVADNLSSNSASDSRCEGSPLRFYSGCWLKALLVSGSAVPRTCQAPSLYQISWNHLVTRICVGPLVLRFGLQSDHTSAHSVALQGSVCDSTSAPRREADQDNRDSSYSPI